VPRRLTQAGHLLKSECRTRDVLEDLRVIASAKEILPVDRHHQQSSAPSFASSSTPPMPCTSPPPKSPPAATGLASRHRSPPPKSCHRGWLPPLSPLPSRHPKLTRRVSVMLRASSSTPSSPASQKRWDRCRPNMTVHCWPLHCSCELGQSQAKLSWASRFWYVCTVHFTDFHLINLD
jgi:hypothetical protein